MNVLHFLCNVSCWLPFLNINFIYHIPYVIAASTEVFVAQEVYNFGHKTATPQPHIKVNIDKNVLAPRRSLNLRTTPESRTKVTSTSTRSLTSNLSKVASTKQPRNSRHYNAVGVPSTTIPSLINYDIPIIRKVPQSKISPTFSTRQRHGQRQRKNEMSITSITEQPSIPKEPSQLGNSSTISNNVHYAGIKTVNMIDHSHSPADGIAGKANDRRASNYISTKTGNKAIGVSADVGSASSVTRSITRKPKVSASLKPSSATTTTTSTTTTPRSLIFGSFSISNPFNLFVPNFWNLSNLPQTSSTTASNTVKTTTRKPPKKYAANIPVVAPALIKDDKQIYRKSKISPTKQSQSKTATSATAPIRSSTETTTIAQKKQTDGPLRVALPTINFFNSAPSKKVVNADKEKDKRDTPGPLREQYNCPRENEVRFQLFPKICKIDKDCNIWKREELCCEIFGAKSCVSGKPKPLEETSHSPILGLIPRKCPSRPLAELWWDVQECATDMDCWPRVCCPDGKRRYCRTSQPELETVPVPVKRSFNYLTDYLECTPPPPPIFDVHPKVCTSTLDCFPNVCCQEAGLRHCRPPKKSVLTLMANFLNVDFVKRLTQNIVIK